MLQFIFMPQDSHAKPGLSCRSQRHYSREANIPVGETDSDQVSERYSVADPSQPHRSCLGGVPSGHLWPLSAHGWHPHLGLSATLEALTVIHRLDECPKMQVSLLAPDSSLQLLARHLHTQSGGMTNVSLSIFSLHLHNHQWPCHPG